MPYILFSLKVKGTTQEQLIMGFPVYSTILFYKFYILVRPELFNMPRITHKDFKNGCFFLKVSAGLAQISETSRFRDRDKTETLAIRDQDLAPRPETFKKWS